MSTVMKRANVVAGVLSALLDEYNTLMVQLQEQQRLVAELNAKLGEANKLNAGDAIINLGEAK